jgi:hypothetical protein
LAQAVTATISPTTRILPVVSDSRTEGSHLPTEVPTLKEADWVPPLPPKYKDSLQSGTAPELVIWEMFKRIIELRSLLEDILMSLPQEFKNGHVEQAQAFLRRHCASCGDAKAEGAEIPICEKCQSLG